MSDYVPTEVLIDILKRLPVDSLLRLRCVCKAWYTLISSPCFISTHLNRKISNNDTHLLVRHCPRTFNNPPETYSLHSHHQTFDVLANFTLPFTCFESYFRIIGLTNGLLCLSDDTCSYTDTIILWNPSIRKYLNVPTPNLIYRSYGPYQHAIGFGFTPSTHDYKIVRLVYPQFLDGVEDPLPPLVELYELSTGAWRNLHVGDFSYVVRERNPQAFVNGCAHWIGIKCGCNYTSDEYGRIVRFDMVSEELGLMRLPNGVGTWTSRVAVLHDSLSLINQDYSRDGGDGPCCVWVMKEYGKTESWTKLFAIDLKQGDFTRPFGFRGNGDVLMATERGDFVSYDPNTQQTRTLGISGCVESFYGDTFVESLVLLASKEFVGDLVDCKGTSSLLSEEEDEFEEN